MQADPGWQSINESALSRQDQPPVASAGATEPSPPITPAIPEDKKGNNL